MAEAMDLSQRQQNEDNDIFEDSVDSVESLGGKQGSRGGKRNAFFSSSSGEEESFTEGQKEKMKNDILDEVRRLMKEELREEIRAELKDTLKDVIKESMREAIKEEMKVVVDVVQELRRTVEKVEEKVNDVKAEVSEVKDDISMWKDRVEKLEDMMIDQQSRSRRNNLMFYGVEEKGGREDCKQIVRDLIVDKCGVTGEVKLERVHRIPPGDRPAGSKIRPIVCKFLDYNDKMTVKKNAKKLPAKINVGDDHPKEIREARKLLVPELKAALAAKKDAFIAFPAKLIVDKAVVKSIKPSSVGRPSQQRTHDGSA